MRASIRVGVLALAIVVGAADSGRAADDAIRIGWQPAAFFEFFLAREERMFEKAGLKPTFVKFISGPAMFAALKSGDIDVTFGGMPPFVYGLAQDLDVSIFLWSFVGNLSLVVRPDSGIETIENLAGKKIATVMGSSAHYTLLELLADYKIPASKVEILNMQVPSLLPAFTNGDIPAAIIWEPWGVKLTSAGGKRVGPYSGYTKYSQTAIYWGRREWMSENAPIMKKFLGVIDEAIAIVRVDPARGAKALANQAGLDPAEALEILKIGVQTYVKDLREPLSGHPLAMRPAPGQKYAGHVEALGKMADFLLANGNIRTPVTRDRLLKAHSPELLEAYLKDKK